ncbi:glyoxalase superfamily protein [Bdellovibrio sp. BCCA]|uniref:glyoxalase superfamily protein n=1 Tax=Bdellovibrio sp. BCCA TaxID=3136281 RepID=UPI0030F16AB2
MTKSRIESLKTRAKLLQKSKAKNGEEIQLKEALNKIAQLSGFENWRDLKHTLEVNDVLLNHGGTGPQTLPWFKSYEEACAFRDQTNGILVPYQKDFFVADEDYLKSLGFSEQDPDFLKVGRNWAEPKDPEAWGRLLNRMKA